MDAVSDRIIVALDVSDPAKAWQIINETKQYVGWYKIGLELIATQNCAQIISWVKQADRKVFYDIKLHDIPTTVERAVKAARGLGVDLINVHALSGVEAMQRAKDAAGDAMMVAAVTVLTSMDYNDLLQLGFDMSGFWTDDHALEGKVVNLASLAYKAGVPGLICSAKDLSALDYHHLRDKFITITPAIRPEWAAANDQKRITTPAAAVRAGSSKMVVGRPITDPPAGFTRETAAKAVYDEIYSLSSASSSPCS